uniref:SFRICE_024299 n=1 Tax=Spodoptera frugiperda TaxID=7108 RepID=A0A2H1WC43_SPOFR
MRTIDGFPTIDISHNRAAHIPVQGLPGTATLLQRIFIVHLTRTAPYLSISGNVYYLTSDTASGFILLPRSKYNNFPTIELYHFLVIFKT